MHPFLHYVPIQSLQPQPQWVNDIIVAGGQQADGYETVMQISPAAKMGTWDIPTSCVVYYGCLPSEAICMVEQGGSRRA